MKRKTEVANEIFRLESIKSLYGLDEKEKEQLKQLTKERNEIYLKEKSEE